MADVPLEKSGDGHTEEADSPQTISPWSLYFQASRLQQDAKRLRIEQRGDFDEIAYNVTAMVGIAKSLLAEQGHQDLVDRLEMENRPSDLPGVRMIPLE